MTGIIQTKEEKNLNKISEYRTRWKNILMKKKNTTSSDSKIKWRRVFIQYIHFLKILYFHYDFSKNHSTASDEKLNLSPYHPLNMDTNYLGFNSFMKTLKIPARYLSTIDFYQLTDILLVSGSATTPMFFRSKSPMLRVMANLPLTFGCPRLFQVIKPPLLFILVTVTEGDKYKKLISINRITAVQRLYMPPPTSPFTFMYVQSIIIRISINNKV